MFRTSLLLFASLVSLAVAQSGSSQCTSGEIVCCRSVQSAYDVPNLTSITGKSTDTTAGLGLVGSTCSTLTVIGVGMSCVSNQQPMCCTDNNYNGAVSLGCSHLNAMQA